LSDKSTLTVAPPAAFGFLSPAPATITMQGSTLAMPSGKSLSLVGGDVGVTGGTLSTPSGRLSLVSVGEPGEVSFDYAVQAPTLRLGSVQRLGTISLSHGATLGAVGNPGGTVTIRGGRLVMTDNAEILANAAGSMDVGNRAIDVQVAEDVVIDGGKVFAGSLGAERARDVAITAGAALTVTNEGSIGTVNLGSAGGNIHIDVGRLTLTGGGAITSGTGQGGTGQGERSPCGHVTRSPFPVWVPPTSESNTHSLTPDARATSSFRPPVLCWMAARSSRKRVARAVRLPYRTSVGCM
jgi:hypothetical protein